MFSILASMLAGLEIDFDAAAGSRSQGFPSQSLSRRRERVIYRPATEKYRRSIGLLVVMAREVGVRYRSGPSDGQQKEVMRS